MTEIPERFCVVCGLGSHRTDWATKTPACDNHTPAQVAAALRTKQPTSISQSVETQGQNPPPAQPPK